MTAPIDCRAFAVALAHEFDMANQRHLGTNVLAALVRADEATAAKCSVPVETDVAELRAQLRDAHRALNDARLVAQALRTDLLAARVKLAFAQPPEFEPITPSAPLRVGDMVRLRDARVESLPHGENDCLLVYIDGEATRHGDNPGSLVYPNAIAGRVRA